MWARGSGPTCLAGDGLVKKGFWSVVDGRLPCWVRHRERVLSLLIGAFMEGVCRDLEVNDIVVGGNLVNSAVCSSRGVWLR